MVNDTFMQVNKKMGESSYLLEFIKRKCFVDEEDFIFIATGKRGKGKSTGAIRLGEAMAKYTNNEFNVDYVCYTVKSFIAMINSGRMKKGSVIIMDETGVSANARRSMTHINQALNYLGQTIRAYNYILVFCVPNINFIDKSVRSVAGARLHFYHIDRTNNLSHAKFYLMQDDQRSGVVWEQFLRYKVAKNPKTHYIKRVLFRMPGAELIEEYKKKKLQYSQTLYKDLQENLDDEMGEIDLSGNSQLTDKQARVLWLMNNCKLRQSQAAQVLDSSVKSVHSMVRAVNGKGHKIRKKDYIALGDFREKGVDYFRDRLNEWLRSGGQVLGN